MGEHYSGFDPSLHCQRRDPAHTASGIQISASQEAIKAKATTKTRRNGFPGTLSWIKIETANNIFIISYKVFMMLQGDKRWRNLRPPTLPTMIYPSSHINSPKNVSASEMWKKQYSLSLPSTEELREGSNIYWASGICQGFYIDSI